ncbi:hypothetical protein ACJX0J_031782 [Zea mays]
MTHHSLVLQSRENTAHISAHIVSIPLALNNTLMYRQVPNICWMYEGGLIHMTVKEKLHPQHLTLPFHCFFSLFFNAGEEHTVKGGTLELLPLRKIHYIVNLMVFILYYKPLIIWVYLETFLVLTQNAGVTDRTCGLEASLWLRGSSSSKKNKA